MKRVLEDYNLTVEDLARKLGYTTQRIRTLSQEGKLPALKRFRRWMFCEAEVIETLQKMSVNNNPVADGLAPSKRIVNDSGTNDPDNILG
jgi:hypothetical protein